MSINHFHLGHKSCQMAGTIRGYQLSLGSKQHHWL